MLTLVLLRHSKAIPLAGGSDHARPLQPGRGFEEAGLAGSALARLAVPALALVSDARRTRETFERVAGCFEQAIPHRLEPELYGASAAVILSELERLAPGFGPVLVVGHNPGLGDLARRLARRGERRSLEALAARFPTSAFALLRFDVDRWADIGAGGRLEAYFTVAAQHHDVP